jgi:alpha-tubulin suppressor-like RCC1 family protein
MVAIAILCLGTVLLLACESATGPGESQWTHEGPRLSRLSSEWVKTILTEEGNLFSWGPGFYGTLGLGDLEGHDIPQRITALDDVVSYAQNGGGAFALDADGDLYFWGNFGWSSEPPDQDTTVLIPTKIAHLEDALAIDYGVASNIHFIREDGSLGRVVHDFRTPTATLTPEEIPLPRRVRQVSGSLGLFEDGTLFTLHDSEIERGGRIPDQGGISAIQNVFNRRTVYLAEDGLVWAWGQNGCGELGNGSREDSSVPVQVVGLSNIIMISANYDYNLALREDGSVFFWGFRGKDQEGLSVCRAIPLEVPGIGGANDIFAHLRGLIGTESGEYFVFHADSFTVEPVILP